MVQAKKKSSKRGPGAALERRDATAAKPRKMKTADSVFYELTRSMCPECKDIINAEIHLKDGKVIMRKRCLKGCNGGKMWEVLISPDAEGYVNSLKYNKPGTIPLEFSTEIKDGCPFDCGLCPDHKQHACLVLIEVNTACNLACPTCFADAGPGYNITLDECETMLDTFVRTEAEPESVQFSGGEPTLHPQLFDMIRMARDKGVRHIMVNTNGLRIVRDPEWAVQFAALKPTIYFQFDGLRDETYVKLRGEPLLEEKLAVLDKLAEFGLNTILVAAIERGVNEDEVPAIVEFGIKHPAVRAVMFQPVTHTGRHLDFDPMDRVTIPEVIDRIDGGTGGKFVKSDFVPVPCCHPSCQSITYAYIDDDGTLTPLPRIVDVDEYLDYLTNRAMPGLTEDVKEALEALWSSSATPGSEKQSDSFCVACGDISLMGFKHTDIARHIFSISIKDFQDAYTFDIKKLMKCCVQIATPDGRLIPFCAYNNVGYREEVRDEMVKLRARERIQRIKATADLKTRKS